MKKEKSKLIGIVLAVIIVLLMGATIISWTQRGEWKRSSKTWEAKVNELKDGAEEAAKKASTEMDKLKAEVEKWKKSAEEASAEVKKLKAAAAEKARQESLKLAAIGKGEGIEHALIRQLIADPTTFGFEGDTSDQKAVKTWAQKGAHQIAILAGYVNVKTGEEIRVKGKGDEVAYLLTVDSEGNISVGEYTVGQDGNFKPDPEQTNKLVDDYGKAQFQGGSPDGLQSYEYVHKV
jgi:hypothetical protein